MAFLKRLLCFHGDWIKGRPLGDFGVSIYDYMFYEPYHCEKCKKVKYFKMGDSPVNLKQNLRSINHPLH